MRIPTPRPSSLPDPERCLAATAFLDHDARPVRDAALVWSRGARSDAERAQALFLGVRDSIRYDPYRISLDAGDYRASLIVAQDRGFCVAKAIALAAVSRAVGIPAALGFADVRNHLATDRLLATMRTDVFAFHGYAALYLDGRWVKASPTFNKELCAVFGVPPLGFDGTHDALLHSFDGDGRRHMEYIADHGLHEDLPFEAMVGGWRLAYPHLFEPEAGAPSRPTP